MLLAGRGLSRHCTLLRLSLLICVAKKRKTSAPVHCFGAACLLLLIRTQYTAPPTVSHQQKRKSRV
jgi:hypothetical protein